MFNTRRIALIFFAGFLVGMGLRYVTRPSTETLCAWAVDEWNNGHVAEAERLARNALGRDLEADAARAVLFQVAAHDGQPLSHVAALMSVPETSPEATKSYYEAGELALRAGYAAVAEDCWQRCLEISGEFLPAHDRLISLAGLRLDSAAVSQSIRARAQVAPLTPESIRLLIGAESLHRSAGSMESTLRQFVAQDSQDLKSQLALAKVLNELGRSLEAETLLQAGGSSPDTELELLRTRWLRQGDVVLRELPDMAAVESNGDYWILKGMQLKSEGQYGDAVAALKRAVSLRPLNRQYRSQLCEFLRLAGKVDENQKESENLQILQNLEQVATNPATEWSADLLQQVAIQCRQVGDEHTAALLEGFARSP